jgi:CBS domain-containing protein
MTRSMSRNTRTKGVMEQGSSNTKSRISEKDGEIMRIASRQIISTYPSNTIKNAAAAMRQSDVRRLPVLRAGTNKLEGIIKIGRAHV